MNVVIDKFRPNPAEVAICHATTEQQEQTG
jgi:hypothetical protein